MEFGTEAAQLLSWEYINGIFVAVCYNMCEAVARLHLAEKSLQFHVFFYCADADVLFGTGG